MQKLYCYIDESGQDPKSEIFIVVTVVSDKEQSLFRNELVEVESLAKTGRRKWHKSRSEKRLKYLRLVLENRTGKGEVYFGRYKKPLPYFLPILETLERGIKAKAKKDYRATIYIDGIDKKKSAELTNALRVRGIRLSLVRSVRDESEPLVRLADMWAGCIRQSLLGGKDEKEFFEKAKRAHYLHDV